jgi:hypothetical protein
VLSFGDETSGKILAKKLHYCWNFFLQDGCCNIGGRLDAGHRPS